MLARAIPIILEGMRQEYVTRLIVLGAAGVHPDYGKYQNALTNMALWVAKKTLLKHPFVDQAAQERLLAASDVDYTIVRAPRLMDGPFTGNYRVLPDALPPGRCASTVPTSPTLCCSSSPIRASIARALTSVRQRLV